ncbi:MAG TPA: alanine--tRNA ligase, partial [Dehalococcoidia bacterium]|nr:alanine--tRNA ligase [Dehalococcoidia bacterium]
NLVFMSFYCDGEERTPLPSNNVDTGSGLERVSSALLFETPGWDKNRLPSCYDTDLFSPLIKKIEALSGKTYGADHDTDRAIRILAEHARAVTFLIGDERTPVPPSNEERGYVVRRMLRRALYFAQRKLGITDPIMATLAETAVGYMAASYPELERQRGFIKEILDPEERRFDETLSRGLDLLEEVMTRSKGTISGADAFTLHDTYGFPIELTREIAAENGFAIDEPGFQAEMERQRERGRASAGAADHVAAETLYASLSPDATAFLGYEALEAPARIVAVLSSEPDLRAVDLLEAPGVIEVILDQTPFYPEGGGQVGDRGEIRGPGGVVRVEDTQRVAERIIVHRGRVTEGRIAKGDEVTASVDAQHRADTMRNHTATHLLHAALRKVLGTHARQAGSLVGPDYLRFDFTHTEAVTPEQLAEVSQLVNEKVRQDIPVSTRTTTFDKAMDEGVLAFFGDKYGAEVRVVEVNSVVPRFSAELCGGTHCHATGQVGAVIITGESSIGSGMRRIEALTGRAADAYIRDQQNALVEIARKVGAPKGAIMAKIDALVAEQDAMRKRIEKLERAVAAAPSTGKLMDNAVSIDGIRVLATEVDAPSMDALRYVSDSLRKDLTSGVAVLAARVDGRPQFVAIVSKDLMERGLHAGNLLKRVATAAGGGGGGRPDMAQGGGKDISKIGEALGVVPGAVREMLGGN